MTEKKYLDYPGLQSYNNGLKGIYATKDLATSENNGLMSSTDKNKLNNLNVVEMTQAEYDALSTAEKNNGTIYFITDGDAGGAGSGDMEKTTYDPNNVVANAGGIDQYVDGVLDDKVDKVTGKGLSTNDYDDTAKGIVDGVTGALSNKVDKVSGKSLSTNDYTDTDKAIVDGVTNALADKVDKVTGKGLSTNDYTDADKTKLSGIASGAEVNVQSDWEVTDDSSDAFIKNKPTIPDAQVNSDWNASSGKAQILNKPTLGTASAKNVPSSGNAASEEVVMGNDSRLTDSRTPKSHTHTKSEITDFPTLGTASSKDVASSGNASATQVVMGNDSRLTDARNAADVSAWAKASTKPTYTASEVGAIATSAKGTANGVAELDSTGKVPSSQLPSYVDDVIEGYYYNSKFYKESAHTTEISGEAGKIYTDLSTDKTYRWSGTAFTQIKGDLALGETSTTAYRGDRGKIAYDHSQSTHARTDATKVEASSTNGNIKINGTETTVYTHPGSGTNPHGTTKSDVGLGNVGNFKAVSTVSSQGLTDTEKSNARANIGAGTGNGTVTQIKVGTTAYDPSSGVVSLPAYPTNTDTKVTSAANHYAPSADSSSKIEVDASSSTAATWNSTSLVTGVNLERDSKGHVTGMSVDSIKMPANPNSNTTYTFAEGSTNGAFNVTPSGGSAQSVPIHGLGSAAYTASTDYATASHTHSYLPLSGGTMTGRITTAKPNTVAITGSGTAATTSGSNYIPAKWTFNTGLNPTDGDVITIKVPVAGNDYGTYLSINNGTSYHPIATNGNGRLSTHYPVGERISLVFKSDGQVDNIYSLAGSTARSNVTGGSWSIINYYDSGNSRKSFYGTCSTAAANQVKVVTLSDTTGWELRAGTIVGVKFTNTNTYSSTTSAPVKLNVNSTGDKNIVYNGVIGTSGNTGTNTSIYGVANHIFYYMYDGTNWVWLSSDYRDGNNYHAVCFTAAGTAAKTATASWYTLRQYNTFTIYMQYTNTAASALTLNVNGTGAKPIYINGSASSASVCTLPAGAYLVKYDGTNYQFRTDDYIPVNITGTAYNVRGTVAVANGGTGQTTLAAARNAMGLGNTTGALPVANGGTGATTAANARTNLGIGSVGTLSYGSDTTKYLRNDGTWQVPSTGAVSGVKGNSESSYRTGNVNITAANIGLGNVGNFKAVSTVGSQGLTDTEKSNARANIGAGTGSGTVTSVATGVGLTGGTITGSGTIKAKLKTETAHTLDSASQTNTASRQYAVGVDKSGYLSVNVPWSNTWTANSASAAGYVASGSGQANKVWKTNADGVPAWRDDANTTYGVVSKTANGLTPQLPNETTTEKFLRQDGSWQVPDYATISTTSLPLNFDTTYHRKIYLHDNSSGYDFSNSRYCWLDRTVTLKTDGVTTVTFDTPISLADKIIEVFAGSTSNSSKHYPYQSINTGSSGTTYFCQVTFPPQSTADTIKVRLYIS